MTDMSTSAASPPPTSPPFRSPRASVRSPTAPTRWEAPSPASARYWRWPYWDKESLYFVSNKALGQTEALKVRLYHDRFDNEINSFMDGTYTTPRTAGPGNVGPTGRSIYKDRTSGGSAELESFRFDRHDLRFVTHYKTDEHNEIDGNGVTNTTLKDTLFSFGAEDNIRLGSALTLSVGVARHQLQPDEFFRSDGVTYTLNDMSATDGHAGLFYDWSATARLYATVARKTRLPTLKDRYSQRMGTFIENPSLQPEQSMNYEVGYQGRPGAPRRRKRRCSTATSATRSSRSPMSREPCRRCGTSARCGRRASRSVCGGRWPHGWSWAANYTFTYMENVSSPNTRLTNVPRHKITAHASLHPFEAVDVVAFGEYDSSRWASSTVNLAGFTTLNLKAVYRPAKNIDLEGGVSNLTDEDYALADGFPSPGRMLFANVTYKF